jgi:hypothetical protein
VFIAIALFRESGAPTLKRLYVLAAMVVVTSVFAALVAAANPRIVGPLTRMRATLPSASLSSVNHFAREMWNRNNYGVASTAMVEANPLFGIGVGTFHSIAIDYVPESRIPPDNAQNWIRHQIVEFGAIGSLGWIVWLITFAIFVLRCRRDDGTVTWITRGMLVAFGAISMFGMPGQSVSVAITFWAIAFWYVSTRGPFAEAALPRWTWVLAIVVAMVAGAGTARLATTRLRVPERARYATWPYSYGFAAPEAIDGEEGYRRARAHAVAVLDTASPWLSISIRPDLKAVGEPVDLRVWANDGTVLKAQLRSDGPLTAIVQIPSGSRRVLVEAAGRPFDSGRPFFVRDPAARYFLKWEFLDRPPANFNGAGYPRPLSS